VYVLLSVGDTELIPCIAFHNLYASISFKFLAILLHIIFSKYLRAGTSFLEYLQMLIAEMYLMAMWNSLL
jgi:hypothetical protein